MAELQQSVVTDQDTRHQIQTQILTWEENLERLHCEQFRLRCYMASLQSGELPNPKVSGHTKKSFMLHFIRAQWFHSDQFVGLIERLRQWHNECDCWVELFFCI